MKSDTTTQRVVIVHGWADDPTTGWIAWLVDELNKSRIEAIAPLMPDASHPNIDAWLEYLHQIIGEIDTHTVLVGHSLGVYVLLRYLNTYPAISDEKLGKLILVAGFAGHERTEQGRRALLEVNFGSISQRVKQIYNVYSNNDHVVPPDWSRELGESLHAKNIVDPGKGHFAGLRGCSELPSVLNLILS